MKTIVALLFAALFAFTANAETLLIGPGTAEVPNSGAVGMLIDLSSPAVRAGQIESVTWSTSSAVCPVYIRFYRRTGDHFLLIAERGPFEPRPYDNPSANPLVRTVSLNPVVDVAAGDFIAVAAAGSCSAAVMVCRSGLQTRALNIIDGDVVNVMRNQGFEHEGCSVAVQGRGTVAPLGAEILTGLIPAVGSAAGNHGAFFRTSMQLSYPAERGTAPLSGRLIFHKAGAEGSPDDPSLPFVLQPNQVLSYQDIVRAMGLSGLGSIDVVGHEGDPIPVITTRVYNDAGANGTSGNSMPMLTGGESIIEPGHAGYLISPLEVSRTRFNIGVRTLQAATVTFTVFNAAGVPTFTTTRSYPRDFFEQFGAESVLGTLASSRLIEITSTAAVIVYGSVTDNVTNDPTLNLAVINMRR